MKLEGSGREGGGRERCTSTDDEAGQGTKDEEVDDRVRRGDEGWGFGGCIVLHSGKVQVLSRDLWW